MTKSKRLKNGNILKRKNIVIFFIVTLFLLILLNSLNQYIPWTVDYYNLETSISAIDEFTIGHIITGIIVSMFTFLILISIEKTPNLRTIFIVFMISLLFAVLWEFFENSHLIINTGLKNNNTADSQINMVMDILSNVMGTSLVCLSFWYFVLKKK